MNTESNDPRLPRKKTITVGVFPFDEANYNRFNAYTRWYNPQWKGCCEHKVFAVNGTEAKRMAIAEHKEKCLMNTDKEKHSVTQEGAPTTTRDERRVIMSPEQLVERLRESGECAPTVVGGDTELAQKIYDALAANDDINTWHKETILPMITGIVAEHGRTDHSTERIKELAEKLRELERALEGVVFYRLDKNRKHPSLLVREALALVDQGSKRD